MFVGSFWTKKNNDLMTNFREIASNPNSLFTKRSLVIFHIVNLNFQLATNNLVYNQSSITNLFLKK